MAKRKVSKVKSASKPTREDVACALRSHHTDASDAKINALVERVIELAQMAPDEIVELVDSGEADKLLDIKELELHDGFQSLLRPWNSIKRASPRPLSDEEYKRFLQGLDPVDDKSEELEVYGAHVK
jgi:hypothetical protein